MQREFGDLQNLPQDLQEFFAVPKLSSLDNEARQSPYASVPNSYSYHNFGLSILAGVYTHQQIPLLDANHTLSWWMYPTAQITLSPTPSHTVSKLSGDTRFTVKHSKAGLQTSSHPQNSASHLLELQGPQQIPIIFDVTFFKYIALTPSHCASRVLLIFDRDMPGHGFVHTQRKQKVLCVWEHSEFFFTHGGILPILQYELFMHAIWWVS